jgi:hypothetical protein
LFECSDFFFQILYLLQLPIYRRTETISHHLVE